MAIESNRIQVLRDAAKQYCTKDWCTSRAILTSYACSRETPALYLGPGVSSQVVYVYLHSHSIDEFIDGSEYEVMRSHGV